SAWQAAGKPAELHIYAKGGHGFGTKTQQLPVDSWLDRFGAWLAQQGFPIVAAKP
ncbi:MAG: alpha/beta hydrolase, partial [Hymenobacter sp.]